MMKKENLYERDNWQNVHAHWKVRRGNFSERTAHVSLLKLLKWLWWKFLFTLEREFFCVVLYAIQEFIALQAEESKYSCYTMLYFILALFLFHVRVYWKMSGFLFVVHSFLCVHFICSTTKAIEKCWGEKEVSV